MRIRLLLRCLTPMLLMLFAANASAQNARVQFIHASGDIDASPIDVYTADTLKIDDFAFRSATAFMDVAAGSLNVKISPNDQAPGDSLVAEVDVVLTGGETYVMVIAGISSPNLGKYVNGDPGSRDITISVFNVSGGQEASADPAKVDFMVFHAGTDGPAVDVLTGGATLVDDLDYGGNTGYLAVDPAVYTLDVTPADDNATIAATFTADLSGLAGSAAVVFASGFLDPASNESASAFGLHAALPTGDVVEFERVIMLDPGPWVNKGMSRFMFESVFEDTTVVLGHGVAVDPAGNVWTGSFSSSAAGLVVRAPDGTEAGFSPIATVTVDGVDIDIAAGGCRGMTVAADGNILYAKGPQLIKIDYMTGAGMALWEEPGGNSLTNPSVDSEGFIYVGLVVGVNPVYVLNGETLVQEQTITLPNAPGFSRGVLVSEDATTLWTGDLGTSGGPLYKWTSTDFINYTITDSIFANTDAEQIFTTQRTTMNRGPNGTMWVSHDNAYAAGDNSPNGLFGFDFRTMEYVFLPMPDDLPGTGNGPRNVAFSASGDTAYVTSFNAGRTWRFVREPVTRMQVIHNSADIDGRIVDVYGNGELLLEDFTFRSATPFMDIEPGTWTFQVTPPDSLPADSLVAEVTVTLEAGGSYVGIAGGIVPENLSKYLNPDPNNRDISFTIFAFGDAQEAANDPSKVEFRAFHGSTDAPPVDVVAQGGGILVDNADYGDATGYIAVDPAAYLLDVTLADDNDAVVATFDADLTGLAGGAAVVFASGFVNPAANEGGNALGLFAALPNGDVVEFERIIQVAPGPWINAGDSPYTYDTVFEDTTVVLAHGVAVDPANRVWSGSFSSSAAGIIVRDPDGTEAPFSPLATVTVDGVDIDLAAGGNRGMATAKDGNILYAKGPQLIKIDYMTGAGMALWEEPEGNSLTNPSVDDEGFIYVGKVVGVNPVYVLNGETLVQEQTITLPDAPGFSRGVLVSPDGASLWTGDLGTSGGPLYEWTSSDFINYAITDSIFANTDSEQIFTTQRTTLNRGPNGTIWVSHDNAYAAGDNSPNGLFTFDPATSEYTFLPMPDDIPGTGNGPRNVAFSVTGDTAYVASFNAGRIWRFVRGMATSVGDDAITGLPTDFDLLQNYPNPFNPATLIPFDLPEATEVELKVFDSLGREVRTLVSGTMAAGRHEVQFTATGLASGMYFYRLKFNGELLQKRMLLVK